MKKRLFGFGFMLLMLMVAFTLTTYAASTCDVITYSPGVGVDDAPNNTLNIYSSNHQNTITFSSFHVAQNEIVQLDGNDYIFIVNDGNTSSISGRICGDGNLFIINPNGVFFDTHSVVEVSNLYVSTRPIDGTDWNDYTKDATTAEGDITFLGVVQAHKVTLEANNVVLNADKVIWINDLLVRADGSIDCGISCSARESARHMLDKRNIGFKHLNGNPANPTAYRLVHDSDELEKMKNNPYENYMLANEIYGCSYEPFEPIKFAGDNPAGSILSEGKWWIIGGVAVLALGGVAALLIVKKKKKPVADGEE